jgi:hypothetical protein
MRSGNESRLAAVSAFTGVALLAAGTLLHPMQADPNDAIAAFTEYAADRLWVASHLAQLAGVALIIVTLLVLARQLEREGGSGWSRLASAGAIVSLALAGALQAVDGIALKHTVDAWAAAGAPHKDAAFHAAFAVRQIEIGLAAVFCMALGVTAAAYGGVLLRAGPYPEWLGALALGGGILITVAGVAIAYTGFSPLAMAINMPATLLLVLWVLALGVFMWRNAAGRMA